MDALYQLLQNISAPITLTAQGHSMWPTIKPGDQLEIIPCRTESLRVGDVVAIYRAGVLTCHRLIACWHLGRFHLFFEKGDNQRYGQLLRLRAIIGKVNTLNGQPLLPAGPFLTGERQLGLILRSWLAFTIRRCQQLILRLNRMSSSQITGKENAK